MSENSNNIDDLIERIRAKADGYALDVVAGEVSGTVTMSETGPGRLGEPVQIPFKNTRSAVLPLIKPLPGIEFSPPNLMGKPDRVRIESLLILPDEAEFIRQLFIQFLGREPDESGYTHYLQALHRHGSRVRVAVQVAASKEARNNGVRLRGARLLRTLVRLESYLAHFYLDIVTRRLTGWLESELVARYAPVASVYALLQEDRRAIQKNLESRNRLQARQWQEAKNTLDTWAQAMNQDVIRWQDRWHEQAQLHLEQWEEHWQNRWYAERQSIEVPLAQWRETIESHLKQWHHDHQALELWRQSLDASLGQFPVLAGQIDALARRFSSLEADLALARAFQAMPVRPGVTSSPSVLPPKDQDISDVLERYYVLFEDFHRGKADDLAKHFSIYDNWIATLPAKSEGGVLDLGCGRGEWLDYLSATGRVVKGIDANAGMIERCRERGLDTEQADLLTWLRAQPDASLVAVTAFHVVEHLPFATLYELVGHCFRVLKPGGKILFETPNPENILVGSHTFYHDYTHRNPVTPTALQFLVRYHGFTGIDVIRSSPYPDDARVVGDDLLTDRVNGHLCGPQDYAVIAHKPSESAA